MRWKPARFVFVTGQLATDPDDDSLPIPAGIEAQTRKVMDNLARVLKGCGLTFANVVCVRIFLTDFKRDYAAMNEIYASLFRSRQASGAHHGRRHRSRARRYRRDRHDRVSAVRHWR